MYPDLFSIGNYSLHTYGLFVAAGFLAGLLITVRIGKTEGFTSQQIMDMGFIIVLSAIIGSRLMYVLMNARYYISNPLDIMKVWQGGLVFSGGIIGVVLMMSWYIRRHRLPFWKTADLWAPAAAIGQGIGRIGCLMAGCCHGRVTDSLVGIIFTHPDSLAPLNIPIHPTQIYASISGFAIFAVLILMRPRRIFHGQIFLWYIILHSTSRLFIERFRGDDRGMLQSAGMSITQLVSILLLTVSVIALIMIKSRIKNKNGQDS
ncbi:MAG: prolipoprotein diacylglyceryl transferase [Deltaproteobacteria bacterium]|nr:prolipoprotein diacylglyceryl transferase [Deltaproteobacteria bacterium]